MGSNPGGIQFIQSGKFTFILYECSTFSLLHTFEVCIPGLEPCIRVKVINKVKTKKIVSLHTLVKTFEQGVVELNLQTRK